MDYITAGINLLGLVALFLYQRYRLSLLSEALARQGTLLTETKNVVSQQATAISSQSAVVDAAVKYSQAFSPDRIEQMVRRELEIEHKGEKCELEQKVQALSDNQGRIITNSMGQIADKISERFSQVFTPILSGYAIHLLKLPDEIRDAEIQKIEPSESRELVKSVVVKGKEMLEAAGMGTAP
ncbi:hypothetical protein H9L17_04960 [Thermomonas brevis]|uniref:Uncharacterized protein n=1 Tax=Thermomonas brevis TaxID=215691 RepID=A0A7G9QVW6_9GAMM|nr:hypothetical protein [Thermomonas brevis]QNN47491.1 hypothetical protein H9L17_04960 [Thermomonas brevis]